MSTTRNVSGKTKVNALLNIQCRQFAKRNCFKFASENNYKFGESHKKICKVFVLKLLYKSFKF